MRELISLISSFDESGISLLGAGDYSRGSHDQPSAVVLLGGFPLSVTSALSYEFL